MATEEFTSKIVPDKYRSFMYSGEENTEWRHGGPPSYEIVNRLYEQGRTKEWPKGSLEETVQNAVKTWEMEVSHKIHFQDVKSINPEKFKLIVNGRTGLTAEEVVRIGTYNSLLKSSMPEEFKYYQAEKETFESSHKDFCSAFPRGFAWEVIEVYSGPPVIAFKYRHWGFFEGPYKGHAPTGEMVEFFGLGTLKVDEALRAEEVHLYFDPAELFGGLLKGKPLQQSHLTDDITKQSTTAACPFSHN